MTSLNEFFWKAKIVSHPSQSEQENGMTVPTLFPTPVMNSVSRKEKKNATQMCNTILKSDTSWQWFSTKGGFVPSSPRNRWQHLEALLVVRVGKGGIAADIYQAEAGMLLKRLTIH